MSTKLKAILVVIAGVLFGVIGYFFFMYVFLPNMM